MFIFSDVIWALDTERDVIVIVLPLLYHGLWEDTFENPQWRKVIFSEVIWARHWDVTVICPPLHYNGIWGEMFTFSEVIPAGQWDVIVRCLQQTSLDFSSMFSHPFYSFKQVLSSQSSLLSSNFGDHVVGLNYHQWSSSPFSWTW